MCPLTSLFGFILFTLFITNASPARSDITETPLTRRSGSTLAKALSNNRLGKRDNTIVVQRKGPYYFAYVVTSSSSTYNLIVDTGSSYTWVGAMQNNPYRSGYASLPTGASVRVPYSGGKIMFRGDTYHDLIVLGSMTINPQAIGVPTELTGFPPGADGVLGLGPTRATAGMSSDGNLISTVVDNLWGQGTISHPVLGVYLVPQNVRNVGGGGSLSFGDIDVSVLTNNVNYVPVTQTYPASKFWGVDASIMYGSDTPILNLGSGILDTGSSHMSVRGDAVSAYQSMTGAIIDTSDKTRRLTITPDQYNNLQTLTFVIGDQSYDLSPNAQIFARSSPNSQIFLVVRSSRPNAREDFSLGSPFFQRYYVVFNSSSSQIGFSSHLYTYSTTN